MSYQYGIQSVSHYSSVSFKDSHRTSVMSISCFFANTKNFFYPWSTYIFEYMMTANHTLFEKEGVFEFHVSTCHLEQLVAVDMFTLYSTDRSIAVHVHVAYVPREIHVGRGFIITSLFGAYPLLGAYLLTTYTYKRIRLLTGVYGMVKKKEDSKSWRQGWQAVMLESLYNVGVARQTNLLRGHKNDF